MLDPATDLEVSPAYQSSDWKAALEVGYLLSTDQVGSNLDRPRWFRFCNQHSLPLVCASRKPSGWWVLAGTADHTQRLTKEQRRVLAEVVSHYPPARCRHHSKSMASIDRVALEDVDELCHALWLALRETWPSYRAAQAQFQALLGTWSLLTT